MAKVFFPNVDNEKNIYIVVSLMQGAGNRNQNYFLYNDILFITCTFYYFLMYI